MLNKLFKICISFTLLITIVNAEDEKIDYDKIYSSKTDKFLFQKNLDSLMDKEKIYSYELLKDEMSNVRTLKQNVKDTNLMLFLDKHLDNLNFFSVCLNDGLSKGDYKSCLVEYESKKNIYQREYEIAKEKYKLKQEFDVFQKKLINFVNYVSIYKKRELGSIILHSKKLVNSCKVDNFKQKDCEKSYEQIEQRRLKLLIYSEIKELKSSSYTNNNKLKGCFVKRNNFDDFTQCKTLLKKDYEKEINGQNKYQYLINVEADLKRLKERKFYTNVEKVYVDIIIENLHTFKSCLIENSIDDFENCYEDKLKKDKEIIIDSKIFIKRYTKLGVVFKKQKLRDDLEKLSNRINDKYRTDFIEKFYDKIFYIKTDEQLRDFLNKMGILFKKYYDNNHNLNEKILKDINYFIEE